MRQRLHHAHLISTKNPALLTGKVIPLDCSLAWTIPSALIDHGYLNARQVLSENCRLNYFEEEPTSKIAIDLFLKKIVSKHTYKTRMIRGKNCINVLKDTLHMIRNYHFRVQHPLFSLLCKVLNMVACPNSPGLFIW